MDVIVTDFLDEISRVFPKKIAFAEENISITFSKVRENALKVATKLAQREILHKPIAIYLDKGIDELTCFMGVAYSGNFYSPIDSDMPLQRVNNIMDVLHPECIITNITYVDKVKSLKFKADILVLEDLFLQEAEERLVYKKRKYILSTDVLYVLFTSGSTGIPKGVVISHQSVISYANWAVDTFKIGSNEVLGNQTPFYFSMSVFDIFVTLKAGCKLEIIPKRLFSNPSDLMQYIAQREVNLIYWVPSALMLVANSGVLEHVNLTSMRKVLFAGEVMPNRQLNVWRHHMPDVLFANLFGPTEVTDICTYYIVDREFKDDEPLPIGYPCIDSDVIILDGDKEILRDDTGCIGEMGVRGIQIAYGYYNDKEKTDEVFVQNPLNNLYPEKIYKTGDLVKYNELGEIMYIGRKDFQIKVSGYRIELGEIETAVSSVEKVESNCCLFDQKNQLIVCLFTGQIDKKHIRKSISGTLPRYMMPHKYIKLLNMPLNANGKIDRISLKKKYIEVDKI